MIDSVLVPTDGSDGAIEGAKRGLELAVEFGADVHVLSVVDRGAVETIGTVFSDADAERHRAALEGAARTAIDTTVEELRERAPEATITTTIEEGSPYREIADAVDTADADLIAMGTMGRSGVDRVVLGSTAEKVLRTVEVPVLAVPPTETDRSLTAASVEDVLLPTDGSEGALAAVDWGLELAAALEATVHAVYSVDTSRFGPADDTGQILDALEQVGEDALEEVRERARTRGVSITGSLASGPPPAVVLEAAADTGSDCIVMGTAGRSGVGQRLLGSVTENVLRGADRPVLCVPVSDRS